MRAVGICCLLLITVWCTPTTVVADGPAVRPERKTFWSSDRTAYAISDPDTRVTTVFRVGDDGKETQSWSMFGWFATLHVADDGEHVVTGGPRSNPLPQDCQDKEPMIYFLRKGLLIKLVTLDQLISDRSRMPRSVSHYRWGKFAGFNKKGLFVVETFEGAIVFDPKTGKVVMDGEGF